MNRDEWAERRTRLNARLAGADEFFGVFGALDDAVYAEGAIPRM